ncbi:MAG TPA: serine/threonine-protein kinase [Polyangia bacterium]|jgi:serine/threonine-protein kinase|nr:serine/threonine-protein kinase [Polyangia bacterium]
MIGDAFGNFEVIAKLGKGGMGVVLLAQHPRIARRAAIKVLAPELTRDPDAVKRFLAEARATSLIRHPGIVEVFDCGVDAKGRAYIVMEYLQGETLAAHLDRVGRLPWPEACDFARQIADAVGAAHEDRIIHRDLKPENVFLVATDPKAPAALTVKVLDFGIAKLLAPESSAAGRPESLTLEGVLLGTPRYISPEQCQAASDVDHRTDIYSLGCILFEMIAGEAMFPLDQVHALIAAHLYRPAPALSSLVPEVPPWLDSLIARMVAKKPAERPATMAEVANALASAGRATPHLAAGEAAARASLTLILPPSGPTTTARMRERLRRRLVLVAGVALAVALLAAIGLPRLSGTIPEVESERPAATASAGATSGPAPAAAPAPTPPAASEPTPAAAPAPSASSAPIAAAALPARDAEGDASRAASSSAAPAAPVPAPAARAPSPRRRVSSVPAVPKVPEKRAPAAAPKEADGITDL